MAWSNGTLHLSPDGASWTSAVTDGSFEVGPVAVGDDGTLVSVNGDWNAWYGEQTFHRSIGGISWEALPSGSYNGSHPIFDIAFGRVGAAGACSP